MNARIVLAIATLALVGPSVWVASAEPPQAGGPTGKDCAKGKPDKDRLDGVGVEPDEFFDLQWSLKKLQVAEAWTHSTGRCVIVGLIDGGVDPDHPDYRERLIWLKEADLVDPNGTDGPSPTGGVGGCQNHGTRMAGVLAATANNGIGVAGVAPDSFILPLRVTDCNSPSFGGLPAVAGTSVGTFRMATVARAIHFAVDHGAKVLSMSLGWNTADEATAQFNMSVLDEAIDYGWGHGAVMVAAAGNDNVVPLCYRPASYRKVLCVGAVGPEDVKATYSNFDGLGRNHVMAPGGESLGADVLFRAGFTDNCRRMIVTTRPTFETKGANCDQSTAGPYGYSQSTSTATPHAAGIAALLVALGMDNEEILQRIKCSADDIGPAGRDAVHGYGRINALRAVTGDVSSECMAEG